MGDTTGTLRGELSTFGEGGGVGEGAGPTGGGFTGVTGTTLAGDGFSGGKLGFLPGTITSGRVAVSPNNPNGSFNNIGLLLAKEKGLKLSTASANGSI